jgi:hypothetical protein
MGANYLAKDVVSKHEIGKTIILQGLDGAIAKVSIRLAHYPFLG